MSFNQSALNKFYQSVNAIFAENNVKAPKLLTAYQSGIITDHKCLITTYDIKDIEELVSKDLIERSATSKEKIPNRKLKNALVLYRQITEEARQYHIPCTIAVDIFTYLLVKMNISYTSFIKFFEKVEKDRESQFDYNYTLGLLYYNVAVAGSPLHVAMGPNGEIILNASTHAQDVFMSANEYFSRAIMKDQNNAELFYLLAACHASLGERAEAMRLLAEADALLSMKKHELNSPNLFKGLRTALHSLIVEFICSKKMDDAYNLSTRLYSVMNQLRFADPVSFLLIFTAFKENGKHIEAVRKLLHIRRTLPMDYLPYHLIGVYLLCMCRFYFASICFNHEIEILQKCSIDEYQYASERRIASLLYEYSMAMWFWKKDNFSEASRHINLCTQIIEENNLQPYQQIKILPHIMMLDKYIESMSSCDTVEDFVSQIYLIANSMADVIKQNSTVSSMVTTYLTSGNMSYQEFADSIKSISFLDHLLFAKALSLYVLLWLSDKKTIFQAQCELFRKITDKKKDTEVNFTEYIAESINRSIDFFNELGFTREMIYFSNLKTCFKKLGTRSLIDLSNQEWRQIRNILFSDAKIDDQESIQQSANKFFLLNIENLIIINRSKGIGRKRELDELITTQDRNQVTEGRKTKILIKYYVEFKGKIVTIYRKRDGRKEFLFESKRTRQPYQLLEYFLSREDHRVHWVEAIKIFPDWQVKRSKDIIGLKNIFEGVVAKINTDFNNTREKLLNSDIIMEKITIEEDRGFYTLKTQMESNILNAEDLVKEALNIADDNFDAANKKIVEALQTYDKCIEAAILILELKDKAKFGSKIMNNTQLILSEQRDILQRIVKPTVDYYVREKEKLRWRKTQMNEKIEFNNYIETLANDIGHEIETIKECLKDIPETQDEECEEIKKLIKRDLCKIENSNAILENELIKKLIDNLMHRIRDKQSKDIFERNWAWFKNITTDKELKELLKSWLIDAIERGKKKLNAQFLRAKFLKLLLKHLDKMTMAVAMEEMYRQKTKEELSKGQRIDLKKARKIYAKIMAEYEKKSKGNPTREDIIVSITEITDRDRLFAERILWLLEKGGELSLDDTRYGQKDNNDDEEY